MTAKAKNNQATWELLIAKYQADANVAKEELEANRAQIGMEDTCIKILIDRHRQHLTKKIEETIGRVDQLLSYTYYAPTPRTDERRDESFTRWMQHVSRPSVLT